VQVFFDNDPAPLLYVQSQQINAVAPWELGDGVFNPTAHYFTLQSVVLNVDGPPTRSRIPQNGEA
jgi:uncharacterized protein (TIGR03437 family)